MGKYTCSDCGMEVAPIMSKMTAAACQSLNVPTTAAKLNHLFAVDWIWSIHTSFKYYMVL